MRINSNKILPQIVAPPSKSYEQRLLAAALLSRGENVIFNSGNSDDVIAARNIITQLGCKVDVVNNKTIVYPDNSGSGDELFCNESALCARLFAPIACVFKNKFRLNGSGSLLNRPVAADFYIFEQMGSKINYRNYMLPVEFEYANLQTGVYNVDGSKSSQLISGLMMSLAVLSGDSQLIVHNPVSIDYLNLTRSICENAGVKIDFNSDEYNNLVIDIFGNQKYVVGDYTVEGDWSGIVNLMIAAAINGDAKFVGLNSFSLQADKAILDVFKNCNIDFVWDKDDLIVRKSDVIAFDFDATNCPDIIPALIVLGLFGDGVTNIKGANRLAYKESSRAAVMQSELQKVGAKIEIIDDLIKVFPITNYQETEFDSHNDHRIAMALSILSIIEKQNPKIKNSDSVNKSYPGFFEDINKIASIG